MKFGSRAQHNGWAFRLRYSLATILCSAAALGHPQSARRYVLQTAEGRSLPAVVAENKATGYQQEVTGGWIVLGSDRTFAWRTAYRITENGTVRMNESSGKGSYVLEGDTISLTPEASSSHLEGTLRKRTLAIRADVKLVYQREDGTSPEESAP